uniref:26S proteasome complex subunit dss-1 n=2 Tax=Acrobeloides nanus TaxID=290746 RepID=A0A914EC89_9BILA
MSKKMETYTVSNPNDPKKAEPEKTQTGLDDEEEFEEFPIQDWPGKDTAPEEEEDVNVWEDNWDDETVETDFSKQLADELAKQGKKPVGTEV